MEEWKDIQGFNGYQVSNLGHIRSFKRGGPMEMSTAAKRRGYPSVKLSNGNTTKIYSVHRLVAEAFIPNPSGKAQINHIDGNKENNAVENLEWCSASENIAHAYANGLKENQRQSARTKTPEHLRKLTESRKIAVVVTKVSTGEKYEFKSIAEAARTLGVDSGNLCAVANGRHSHAGGYVIQKVSKER